MSKTNKGLVSYAKAQLGSPYWYGTFGQEGSPYLLQQKARQYPTQYAGDRVKTATQKHLGRKVHDCVGLIKGYLWCDSATDKTPRYSSAQDVSANGMRNRCKEGGKIATMPDIEGVLVFFDGHVGVYIGGGYVVEARGFNYGVVKTALKSRPWTHWGKCPFITYTTAETASKPANSAEKSTKSVDEIAKEVIAGKWGTGTDRKNKLTAAGYNYNEVQKRVNELVKAANSPEKAPTVGAKVKITGKYSSSSTGKTAGNDAAIGKTAYIVKIYEGKAFPYQLGAKKGSSASSNTIGFAKATAFELL